MPVQYTSTLPAIIACILQACYRCLQDSSRLCGSGRSLRGSGRSLRGSGLLDSSLLGSSLLGRSLIGSSLIGSILIGSSMDQCMVGRLLSRVVKCPL